MRKFWNKHKTFRRAVGIILIIVGILAFFTPATPGSWLTFVGLEIFGFRILMWDKIKAWMKRNAGRSFTKVRSWGGWIKRKAGRFFGTAWSWVMRKKHARLSKPTDGPTRPRLVHPKKEAPLLRP